MPKKLPGVPLSYTHVAVEDDEGGASTQMHTWLIDSPKAVPRFLPTALAASGGFGQGKASEEDEEDGAEPEPEPESHEEGDGADAAIAALENPEKLAPILERSVAVICLDMAQPWRMAESLETWVKAVSDETEAVIKRIEVVDPDAAKRVRETLRERVRQAAYSEPKADDAGKPDGAAAITRVAGDSMEELKSSYAGPPLIVVPCKSDEIHNWLAKKASFADAHFDYIKAALRKACLGCGAGLVYTSAKNSLNIDVLRSYVLHRMVPAKPPPALTEEHQLDQTLTFVPAGWDTLKKHESLLEALFTSANESVLTANNTMFAKIEQAISKESKRWARWGEARTAVTFQRAKSAVTFWYLQEIDAGAAKESFATGTKGTFYDTEAQEVTRVLALGLGMTAEEVAEADGEDEAAVGSDFEAFNEKLRAAAPNEFAWVIMDPSRENTQTNLKKHANCANVQMLNRSVRAWTGKAKPAAESLAITDDQAFLEQVSQEKPEKEKESTRSRTAGAARTGSRASPAKSTGAGGDNLSTNAADFFGSLQKSGKVRSLSYTHLRHGTCGTSPSLTRTAAGPAPCGHSLACLCPSQARKPGTRRETIGVGKTLSQPDLACLPVCLSPASLARSFLTLGGLRRSLRPPALRVVARQPRQLASRPRRAPPMPRTFLQRCKQRRRKGNSRANIMSKW